MFFNAEFRHSFYTKGCCPFTQLLVVMLDMIQVNVSFHACALGILVTKVILLLQPEKQSVKRLENGIHQRVQLNVKVCDLD